MAWRGDGRLLSLFILVPLLVAVGWVLYAAFGPDTAWYGAAFSIIGALSLALVGFAGYRSWKRHEHTEPTN